MNKKFLVIKTTIFILLLVTLQIAQSQTIVIRDVEIKIILQDVDENVEHTRLFRVENLDHETGTTDLLHFFVNATLIGENQTITWNTTRSINKFTETGMGTITLDKGKYELCVNLIPLNFHDYNLDNNKDCKIIKTKNYVESIKENITNENFTGDSPNNATDNITEIIDNTTSYNNITQIIDNTTIYENTTNIIENITEENNSLNNTNQNQTTNICDCSLEIITEKEIYDAGERVSFIIRDCRATNNFETPIIYWAEDLFGQVTKTKLETTSKAPKSYTPRINTDEKTFLLKAKINSCNETTTKMIAVKGEETIGKNTTFEIKAPNTAKPNEIIIIEIEGYKAQTQKTLIDIQLEIDGKRKSETLKMYVTKQNQDFHIRLPFQIPNNLDAGEREYTLSAKGLDAYAEAIITINVPEKEQKEDIKITNFYTRKQKFDGELNAIVTWSGTENATIRLTTQIDVKEIETTQKTITVPLKIRKHNETIIAEIIKNNETKDVRLLKLNLEVDEEIEDKKETEEEDEIKDEKTISEEIEEIKTNNTEQKESEIITKATNEIEQTNQENTQKQIITAKTASFIAENKKQTIFIALAFASLVFLFRKETRKIKQSLIKIFK